MSDLKTQLGDYFEHVVHRLDTDDVEDRVGPRPTPLSGLHDHDEGPRVIDLSQPVELKGRPRRRASVWVAGAVAAAAILTVGVAVLPDRESGVVVVDPAVTPTTGGDLDPIPNENLEEGAGPTLTEVIPPDLESGTIVTPVGDLRWVRLMGDSSSLPPAGQAIPWPSGFAIFERPDPGRVRQSATLWVSTDGIDWQLEAIPVPSDAGQAQLSHSNGEYWLISSDPLRVWHSTDTQTWDEYDLSSLPTSIPAGFDKATRHLWPVIAEGDIALFSTNIYGVFPWEDYVPGVNEEEGEPCVEGLREVEPGVFEMVGPGGDVRCPSEPPLLRFEETGTGLRVFDQSTGDELGFIDGADLTHIAQIARTDELYLQGLFVIEDGQVSPAGVPWPIESDARFFGAQGWIYAYLGRSGGPTEVWRTDDARSWVRLDPPEFLAGLAQDINVGFELVPGGPLVATTGPGTGAWATTDGLTWTAAPGQLPDSPPIAPGFDGGTNLIWLASGWFANSGSGGGTRDGEDWWIYLGDEWVSLDEVGIEGKGPAYGGIGSTAVGNITIFFYTDDRDLSEEVRNLWIVSNEPD